MGKPINHFAESSLTRIGLNHMHNSSAERADGLHV